MQNKNLLKHFKATTLDIPELFTIPRYSLVHKPALYWHFVNHIHRRWRQNEDLNCENIKEFRSVERSDWSAGPVPVLASYTYQSLICSICLICSIWLICLICSICSSCSICSICFFFSFWSIFLSFFLYISRRFVCGPGLLLLKHKDLQS